MNNQKEMPKDFIGSNDNVMLFDIDDDHNWLNQIRDNSLVKQKPPENNNFSHAVSVADPYFETLSDDGGGKVGYHTDFGKYPSHPVSVKHHEEYFSGKHISIESSKEPQHPETRINEEEGIYKYLENNPEFQKAMNSSLIDSRRRDRFGFDGIMGFFLEQAHIAGEDPHVAVDKVYVANTMLDRWVAAEDQGVISLRAALQTLMWKKEEKREYELWLNTHYRHSDYENELFGEAIGKGRKNAQLLIPYIAKTQKALEERYPEGYVTIYRGVRGKLGEDIKAAILSGENNFSIPSDGISSFSTEEKIAHGFLYGSEGVVLKKIVPISAILLSFNDVMTYFSGEAEVLVDSSYTSNFDQDEIDIYESKHKKVMFK